MAANSHTTVHRGAPGARPLGATPLNHDHHQLARPAKVLCSFFFPLPPDLKIAGNSIFILLSKNFFLSYRAPLPNFRTSRGAPARSSPAFWAAARTGKIVSTVIIHVQKHIGWCFKTVNDKSEWKQQHKVQCGEKHLSRTADCLPPSPPPPLSGSENRIKNTKLHPVTISDML